MTLQRRPWILGGMAALASPALLFAQPAAGKVYRIGVLSESAPAEPMRGYLARFLSAVGYAEGRNLVMDIKYAQSRSELLPGLAAELLAAKPDLLIGLLNREIIALKEATTTVPIIMMFAAMPVEIGLIASLARPGANITGTSSTPPEMAGKMLQVLRGGLMTYTPDFPAMAQRNAWMIDKIFKGARPSDIPVE